jgi:NAD(P)-dependent dehydrogenase (short-subunit alcohol dehydrogenase family)
MSATSNIGAKEELPLNNVLDFSGKVALVTGAAAGMGLATAKAFADAGAAVVLADYKQEEVKAAAQDLVAAGHKAVAVRCDVSDDAQIAAMVDRTVAEFGRLDGAFNNAGVMAHIESSSGMMVACPQTIPSTRPMTAWAASWIAMCSWECPLANPRRGCR